MVSSLEDIRTNRRIMAYTAAAIYGIAGLDGAIEGFLPGDPPFSMLPVVVVFILFFALMAVGTRFPRWALAVLGPLGVVLIAYALSTSPGPGDGAGGVSVTGVALVVLVLERRNELLMARLAGEARTDPLTGLLNRRGFDEHASRELAHLGRDGHSIALVIFDLDHFKHINDQWGHMVGDRVLAHMARLLTAESRVIDVAARLGGEEFAVLMPGGHQAGATAFAERVRRALAAADWSDVPEVRASAGIAVAVDPLDVQGMLECADRALYAAKRGGRDRTVAFEDPGLSLAA